MMATLVGAFDLSVSEEKTGTMSLPIPHAPPTPIAFTASGQQYGQATSFIYNGGTITESPNFSA